MASSNLFGIRRHGNLVCSNLSLAGLVLGTKVHMFSAKQLLPYNPVEWKQVSKTRLRSWSHQVRGLDGRRPTLLRRKVVASRCARVTPRHSKPPRTQFAIRVR